ncbi:hypothetical protein CDL12_28741 [Handroanthus impetiginosus]|uniref:Uncharacterized protein n=1 Tax=Handroanthus impetiginosus TaxID=429701 RepID=A0A2G9G0W7_9LAMI|nr:hypothetical protein CDL12_28741 [Handroanthus impetiginosus]
MKLTIFLDPFSAVAGVCALAIGCGLTATKEEISKCNLFRKFLVFMYFSFLAFFNVVIIFGQVLFLMN